MSNYTITTNFGAKDDLPSGNAAKVIKGSEFTTEFTNIKTAVNSKADLVSPTFTGNTALNGTTTFGPDGTSTFNGTVNFTKDVTFDTNTMFVDVSENRVGIGNVAPATALDVTGVITTDGLTSSAGIDITGTVTASGLTVDTNTLHVDATNNRVGIGTTSPSYPLDIAGASGTTLSVRNTSTISSILLSNGSSANQIFSRGANSSTGRDLAFVQGTSEAMRIDSSGNVGIGTSSPNQLLSLNSTASTARGISIDQAGAERVKLLYTNSSGSFDINNTTTGYTSFSNNGSERMRIDSSGNVGIGTTNPDSMLHVRKNQTADTAVEVSNLGTAGASTSSSFIVSESEGVPKGWFRRYRDGTSRTAVGFTENLVFEGGIGSSPTERMRIDSSGRVGIGTASPDTLLELVGADPILTIRDSETTGANTNATLRLAESGASDTLGNYWDINHTGNGELRFVQDRDGVNNERMRIDYAGNLLVGKTATGFGTAGIELFHDNQVYATSTTHGLAVNRLSTDGDIAKFYRDSATVGSIGTITNRLHIGSGNTFITFYNDGNSIYPAQSNGTLRDNAIDIGTSSGRFDDIYATNGTIQTSDRNEKQDIAELSDAEQRVAVAAKGLLRKFRWRDAVEEKGDEARIHFGIIAQDLQDAFTAEGLDAGDYAMFINSTWTDEETGEERSRMGVRYSELLAFIISAI